MNSFNLSDIIETKTRFGRSVNLERDFYSDVSLDGYVLTTTALNSLERLTQALANKSATRAWTLTGAFGSGKSTFALFAAKVFNNRKTADSSQAERLIKQRDVRLWQTVFENPKRAPQFFPILISGSREPLAKAILRGVKSALKSNDAKNARGLIAQIEELEQSSNVTGKQILGLFAKISEAVNDSAKQRIGLLVVIDELGKLLEYAALHPGESDIFLLQELAEATKKTETTFFLITILHQAFERYAERLGRREREEWTKIQGRFEDLPFQEPNEQVLHVLQSVFIQDKKSPGYKTLNDYGIKIAQTACDLGLCGLLERREAVSLLRDCLPLHPTVALALGSIFRRFGQNERSLFAFLTSNEPFALSEFLTTTVWSEENHPVIRFDRVYDYLVSAMGSALNVGAEGRKWAEIEAAIERVPAASKLEIRVLKTIGLLYLLGDSEKLKNSREMLHYALADENIGSAEIDDALENLVSKSIITFRRFNDTFIVWEGSDVNLDDRFREAERQIDAGLSLAENLTRYFRPRPTVAKRHSYRTGTLRYFDVSYANPENLESLVSNEEAAADGRIVFALSANNEEFADLQLKIQTGKIKPDNQTVVALPKNLNNLREAVWRTICWRWVQANTPELENDRAARNELAARLTHAEQTVFKWLEDWQTNASENCLWFWQNEERQFASPRALQDFLSTVFDTVFPDTPVLKNELVNRRNLSAAATSARRALFEAMLENADKDNLGIEGFPPQISMYFSLLQETTIHREENGKFGFFPPLDNAETGIRAVWREIESFLNRTENERLTVAELFDVLQSPPFGLKAGILPVLTTAVLLYYDAEVALYERGNFLPKLSLPIFERLCRAPEAFTLQLCRISDARSEVLNRMAEVLLQNKRGGKTIDVLTVARPIVRFAQEFEEYTQHTLRLSPVALNIRRALFSARQPDKLLFKFLPEACGLKEFTHESKRLAADVEEFSGRLRGGLAELKRAYGELLNELEAMLADAFSLPETGGRAELASRARAASEYAASARLKGFILRVSDDELERAAWLESVAALLAGKPPAAWRDDDLAKFEIGLSETARSFNNLESLVFERRRQLKIADADVELLRLSLTHTNRDEQSRVLSIRPQDKEKMAEAEREILKAFDKSNVNGNINLRDMLLTEICLN